MANALAFIGGGLLEGVGKGLVLSGKQKRDDALKKLDREHDLKRDTQRQESTRELMGIKLETENENRIANQATQFENSLALKLAPGAPPSPDRALVEIADPNSPTGTKFVNRADAVGQPGKPPSGMVIEVGEDGTVVRTGVRGSSGDSGLAKKTIGDIEGRLFEAKEGLARLAQIKANFKPEFQTFATRGKAWWAGIKEKAGFDIPDADLEGLQEFWAYRRGAIENINLYIKAITGAQMSEPEAVRIRQGIPDPGEGIFDGDNPSKFIGNVDDTIRSLSLATARFTYALQNGLDTTIKDEAALPNHGISLDQIREIMAQRESEIIKEIRTESPGVSDAVLRSTLQQRLGREFGIF